jgi:polyhydroxyalkanoate synthesis repressor PhaR
MKTIKKYSNRRLYDTDQSQYITLEELAEIIRAGHDVRVVDAKTETDLTQATLAQIVVESRGAARWLPAPLLMQMIRMGDDALAEFMSQYIAWALEVYFQVKEGMRQQSFNPFAGFPFGAQTGLGRLFSFAPWLGQAGSFLGGQAPPRQGRYGGPSEFAETGRNPAPSGPMADGTDELARLRREIDALKAQVQQIKPEEEPSPRAPRKKKP